MLREKVLLLLAEVSVMDSGYNTALLPCGLRVIHRWCPSEVVYCGYEVAAGTRDEAVGSEGLAHFCEHMSFKGTSRRTAMDIINCLEGVGGELNAYTTKDTTVYYAACGRGDLRRAVTLLTDIVFHSIYPEKELDKEIEVVCDEIESFNDSPSELIYDDFENILFAGHPLGHSILGTADTVHSFTPDDVRRFTTRYYVGSNAVFFCYGNVPFDKLCALLERETIPMGQANTAPVAVAEKVVTGETIVREIGSHQAHVMMGRRAYGIHDGRRLPLYLLNNILGGPSMNARLNLSLRERHALVYTVEAMLVSFADTGLWAVYFGCDHKDVRQCSKLVARVLQGIVRRPLSARQLAAAKRQIKGQIALSCDNRESFALDFGKSFLHYGWRRDVSSLCADIDALSADELYAVAQEMFSIDSLTTLVYK